jgi:hypothetical protein
MKKHLVQKALTSADFTAIPQSKNVWDKAVTQLITNYEIDEQDKKEYSHLLYIEEMGKKDNNYYLKSVKFIGHASGIHAGWQNMNITTALDRLLVGEDTFLRHVGIKYLYMIEEDFWPMLSRKHKNMPVYKYNDVIRQCLGKGQFPLPMLAC